MTAQDRVAAGGDRLLRPIPATPESLEGYGWLIAEPDGSVRDKIDFYDEVKVTQPAKFEASDDVCLNLVSFAPREMAVRWMEYHVKHTQTFVPLGGKPFVMVLGKPTIVEGGEDPAGAAGALPDPETVQAFHFDGSGGIVMKVGTWHEVPFPTEGETHFVCICTEETNENLEEQNADGECEGGDLVKRNIAKRFGHTFVVEI